MTTNLTHLKKYAWLSIAAALATIVIKTFAYKVTGSVGLLSDALESVVNLAAAAFALWILAVASRPPDEDHPFGHTKAEYFAGWVEGTLILVAAVSIGWAAVQRLIHPQVLEKMGLGLFLCAVATLINLVVARILLTVGKKYSSITLEADAYHLMTDVWTSAGVIVGVGLVAFTGWLPLDPIIALLVAVNIVWTGAGLVRRAVAGLMDAALPDKEVKKVENVLNGYKSEGIQFHALRTRQAGTRRFISIHILVPGQWSVQKGHEMLEKIESGIRAVFQDAVVFTHLEPIEDPISWDEDNPDR